MNIKENLEKIIKESSSAYYSPTEGEVPKLDDATYDALEAYYTRLTSEEVGIDNLRKENIQNKTPHLMYVHSLKKFYSREELWNKLNKENSIVQPKFDGVSITLQYENGLFFKAVTRGNGRIGCDVTNHFLNYMRNKKPTLLKLDDSFRNSSVSVRTEFQIPKNREDQLNSVDHKNLRNVVSGLCRREVYDSQLELAEMIVIDMKGQIVDSLTEKERVYIAEKNGFIVPPLYEDIPDEIPSEVEVDDLIFAVDGFVIKQNEGEPEFDQSGYPKHMFAFKQNKHVEVTTIKGVEWVMTNKTLVPKLIIEPVPINDAMVTTCSGHNEEFIVKNISGLRQNNVVSIESAGDIIPILKEIISRGDEGDFIDISYPTECPKCGAEFEITKFVRCPNKQCPAKVATRCLTFCRLLEIDGLGLQTLEKLIEKGFVKNLRDLFHVKEEDWTSIDGLGETGYVNFITQINRKKGVMTFTDILVSLKIEEHGRRVLKLVREIWDDNDIETFRNLKDQLISVKGYTEHKYDILLNALEEDWEFLSEMKEYVGAEHTAPYVKPDLKVIVSGGHPKYSRKEYAKILQEKNIEMVSSKSAANMFVCKNVNSNSSKIKWARENNRQIISYSEFDKIYLGLEES